MKKPLILLSFLGLPLIFAAPHGHAKASSDQQLLTFPNGTTLGFSGTSPLSESGCAVTVRTESDGRIAYISMAGAFSGRGIGTPTGLQPASYGYEGIVEFFRGVPPLDVYLERHIFRPGLTLSWISNGLPPHTKEAKFFGKDIQKISSFVFKEMNPFMRISGECQNLTVHTRTEHVSSK